MRLRAVEIPCGISAKVDVAVQVLRELLRRFSGVRPDDPVASWMDNAPDPTRRVIVVDDQIRPELAAKRAVARTSPTRLAPTRLNLERKFVVRKSAHFITKSHLWNLPLCKCHVNIPVRDSGYRLDTVVRSLSETVPFATARTS